nr:MAG TPA: hypothetical protein [Caudoviricetes sp.]
MILVSVLIVIDVSSKSVKSVVVWCFCFVPISYHRFRGCQPLFCIFQKIFFQGLRAAHRTAQMPPKWSTIAHILYRPYRPTSSPTGAYTARPTGQDSTPQHRQTGRRSI